MKKVVLSLFCLALLLVFPFKAKAEGESDVLYTSTTQVKDKFVFEKNGDNNKDINGDLYLIGDSVENDGNISGDIIGASLTGTAINGTIDHNIRYLSAGIITLEDMTANNLTIAAQAIKINKAAKVNNVYAASTLFVLNGTVNNINLACDEVIINGIVKGSGTIYANHITIKKKTVIDGDLTIKSPNKIDYDGLAPISKINYIKTSNKNYRYFDGITFSGTIFKIISMTAMAFLLMWLFSNFINKAIKQLKEKKVATVLWGILWLIAIPLLSLLVMATIIGIGISFVVILAYIILLIIASAFSSIALGELLFKEMNPYLRTFLSVLIITALSLIPVISFFAWLTWIGYTIGSMNLLFERKK